VSDNAITLVPTDPRFVPVAETHEPAKRVLRQFLPEAESVTATAFDEIHLVHPYENLERIRCPRCGEEISLDWWHDAVSKLVLEKSVRHEATEEVLVHLGVATAIGSLDVTTPCCGARASLNDLEYDWPVGFGRFVLVSLNPNKERLSREEAAAVENVVGTPLRQIWTHL
jgi:DNA-directed RNA polymerase subunit N (RpoN/RPB10)